MSKTRTFDGGKLTVRFRTEEEAKSFDDYLESTMTLEIDGKAISAWKVKDTFDPYQFFGVERNEEEE